MSTKTKTIREWFEEIEDPQIREAAIRNTSEEDLNYPLVGFDAEDKGGIAHSVSSVFVWDKTPEGCVFWRAVSYFYSGVVGELPKYPTPITADPQPEPRIALVDAELSPEEARVIRDRQIALAEVDIAYLRERLTLEERNLDRLRVAPLPLTHVVTKTLFPGDEGYESAPHDDGFVWIKSFERPHVNGLDPAHEARCNAERAGGLDPAHDKPDVSIPPTP